MTSPQIKRFAESCDCAACQAITAQDLYVSSKSVNGADWREITARYGPKPCQCGCGEMVLVGDRCFQKTGVGVRLPGHGVGEAE